MKDGLFFQHDKGKEEKASELVVFYHGFPARTTKNEDLRNFVNKQMGFSTLLFHYPGLGESSGQFDFLKCIEFSSKLTEETGSEYKKVHFIGHSWGGLVSTNVAINFSKEKRGELILLNPLIIIPPAVMMLTFISESFGEGGLVRESYTDQEIIALSQESPILKDKYSIESIYTRLDPNRTHFILADQDSLVPFEDSLRICASLNITPQILKDDHWFEHSRVSLIRLIEDILK